MMCADHYDGLLQEAKKVLDEKAKPPGSLGMLEEWASRLSALQRTTRPSVANAQLLLFAGDHGVTKDAAVSAYPREVTAAVFRGIAAGGAASSVMAAATAVDVRLTDVGVDAHVADCTAAAHAPHILVVHNKVCMGTRSFLDGPAMTPEECAAAMKVGADAVAAACQSYGSTGLVVCIGELGIGNTTAASCLLSALTHADVVDCCGRGTGLSDEGVKLKQGVVRQALEVHSAAIQQGALETLAAVGGLEIAAMVGAYREAAARRIPAVVDGFISGVAALVAQKVAQQLQSSANGDAAHTVDQQQEGVRVADVLFTSHRSAERGYTVLSDALGMPAVLDMGLRLGEGTGALCVVPLLRAAAALMSDMATLQQVVEASGSQPA